jgi:signal transduction histidine kinase/ActR/RegA family two-component response regulator
MLEKKNSSTAQSSLGQQGTRAVHRSITLLGATLALFVLGFALLAINLISLESQLVESIALNDAKSYTGALTEFRTLYTAEVVERVRAHGIDVTHDYREREATIPLPATLSILLGNRLDEETETTVRLYSDYPFPRRATDGGVRDDFEQQALIALNAHPEVPYYRFENQGEGIVLRYAIADRMRAGCVDCHNSHPQSPKTDWKEGDVRGVLSIVKPLAVSTMGVRHSLRISVAIMLGLGIIAIIVLGIASVRHRRDALLAVNLAEQTKQTNLALARQIQERDRVESERMQLEKQIHQMQKLEQIGLLAGGIAHDFNNLLQSLLGSVELAMAKIPENKDALKDLKYSIDVASRASDLTNQLLIYAGRAPIIKHPLNISNLIDDMRTLLKTVTRGTSIIELELDFQSTIIEADPTQIRQIVLNLVTNSVDANMDTDGHILVRTRLQTLGAADLKTMISDEKHREPGKYVVLEVQDNGTGIKPDLLPVIFEPFFSTKQAGRGLGLALIHGIVINHGGVLQLETTVNEGSIFRLYLPQSTQQVVPLKSTSIAQTPVSSSLSVLVVDDEEGIRNTVEDYLRLRGFEATSVESGETAIAAVQGATTPFDVIILDMRMPGLSGLETYFSIRQLDQKVRFILVSGDLPGSDVQAVILKGTVDFLPKPFTFHALMSLIQEGKTST